MSAYDNVIGGKLKLKGKALDVKAGGVKKKKKHKKKQQQEEDLVSQQKDQTSAVAGGESGVDIEGYEDEGDKNDEQGRKEGGGGLEDVDELLTPAERRYIDQRERIDVKRLAKTADKSHRDRIQDFNQYLANMSEHYDIPKVGPG